MAIPRDEKALSQIQDQITDLAAIESEEIIKPSLTELKNLAEQFLMQIKKTTIKIQEIENLLAVQKNLRAGKTKSEYNVGEYITNANKIKEVLNNEDFNNLYIYADSFQNALNNFLGQKFQMIFAWVQRGIPTLYTINNTQILKTDYSSSGKVVARYYANKNMLGNALTKIALDDSDQQGIENLQMTYQEVLTRRERHENTMRAMWLNPYSNTPKWHVAKIQQIGDLTEAYADVVLTRQEKTFAQSRDIETQIEIFMVLFWTQVSNEAGSLSGDIESNNIEYGIKTSRATMLSLNQLEILATDIKNGTIQTEGDLRQRKEEMKRKAVTRNVIYEDENMAVEASLEELITNINQMSGVTAIHT